MERYSIMQGDQYGIPFLICDGLGTPLDKNDVENVEIMIGEVRKEMKTGGVVYREEDQAFLFMITQAESFAMIMRKQKVQVRVKFAKTHEVIGKCVKDVVLDYTGSREVL